MYAFRRLCDRVLSHLSLRSRSAWAALVAFVAAGLLVLMAAPAHAQQHGTSLLDRLEESDRIDQVPVQVLHSVAKQAPDQLTDAQWQRLKRHRARRANQPRAKTVPTSDLTIRKSQQQLYGSSWPRQDLNFRPSAMPTPAGDVNGDGVNDWIYQYGFVADNRTADRSDRTAKTLLVFGGNDFGARYYDKLYYRDLRPAGNFIGGDEADAVQPLANGLRVFRGSSQGYVEAGVRRDLQVSGGLTADVNGDGYTDLVSTNTSNSQITVVYGAQHLADVTKQVYDPSFRGAQRFSYAADDIDGDGDGEIVRLAGSTYDFAPGDSLVVDVFAAGDDVADPLSEQQQLVVEGQQSTSASNIPVLLANVDGADLKEIILKRSGAAPLVFTSSSGTYDATPIEYDAANVAHVGDVNGDGRADFTFARNGTVSIGFGPSDVQAGLDADLSFAQEAEPVYVPGVLGDVTGNGRDDIVAQVNPSDQFGVRLVEVSDDGSSKTTTDYLFDEADYAPDGVQQTVNVGDWDGDGTDDVGVVLTDGRVEIYYGDPTESISPDVTLTGPEFSGGGINYSSVAAGDFTGNGTPNLAVAWESDTRTVAVYEAGSGDSPIHTIGIEDLGIDPEATGIEDGSTFENYPNSVVANLGDVNGDGTDDLGITQPEVETAAAHKVFLFYGASSLSSQPDVTVDYSDRNVGDFFGQVLRGVGDINGDGTDDFLVGDTDTQFSGGTNFPDDPFGNGFFGALFVHYGDAGSSPTFGTPDQVLAVPQIERKDGEVRYNSYFGFQGISVGDFNGDDTTDVAAKPGLSRFLETGNGALAVRVFHGGANFDGEPDAELPIPGLLDFFSDTQYAGLNFAPVTALPPASSGGPSRLMMETWNPSNALIYGPGSDTTDPLEKTTLLRGPDQNSGLGTGSNFINLPQNGSSSVGDFNGNGQTNLVMGQLQSADFRGKPAYAYELGGDVGEDEEPVASSTEAVDAASQAGSTVDFGNTGTSVTFSDSTKGSGEVTVDRFESAPDGTAGINGNASEYRVEVSLSGDLSVGDSTEVRFDVSKLEGVSDPSAVTIYTRELANVGEFTALETTYDESANELFAYVSGFSEFAFGSQTEPLFSYPSQVAADVEQTFGDASGPGDYRLVALPGGVDRPIGESLSGEAGTEWQAYWDDGSSFVKYDDGSDTFRFQPGNGFWVTSTQAWAASDTIQSVSLTAEQTARVALNADSSWTIVSNPFDRDVAWAQVLGESGMDQPLWRYDASDGFVRADTFRTAASGTAYYVFNGAGIDSLSIPYPAAGKDRVAPSAGDAASLLALSAEPAETSGPTSTIEVGIGDQRSLIAPPGRFEPVSLRLAPPNGDRSLMVGRRPTKNGGHTFTLRLTSRTDGPVRLSAEHLSAIEGRSVALLHPAAEQTYDLREQSSVTIEPEGKEAALKLAVGTEDYVEGQTSSIVPEKVQLTSYPNPMGQQGTVEYALPEEKEVTLRVYDVLGRQVATLANGQKKAGRHTVQLETTQLSSGVYFGRLRVGDQTITQKITVVR